jgi:hypothetical protein
MGALPTTMTTPEAMDIDFTETNNQEQKVLQFS